MLKNFSSWPWLTLQIIAANVVIILALGIAWYLAFTQQSSAYSERLMSTFNIEPGSLHAMYVEDVERQLWISVVLGLVFAITVSIGLAFLIARPLRSLAMATERLRHGDYLVRSSIERGEVGRLAGNFNALAAALEQEEHRRVQFMSDLGHELRTPIMSLRGYTEGLEDGIFQADTSFYKLIAGELSHLTALTHTIETMRLDTENINRSVENVHFCTVASLLESAKQGWGARFQQRGIQLDLQIPGNLNTKSLAASGRSLKQIIDNLLSNVFKYASSDGTCRIEASMDGESNYISLAFSNDAPDINEESLPFLFDRFYRVSQSRTRMQHEHSSGLGLSVVKQICFSIQGRATASLINGRLVITVFLPIRNPGSNAIQGRQPLIEPKSSEQSA